MSQINIVTGNIIEFTGGCIVNAAKSSLTGGGGVDGAIHRAAGRELLKECLTLGGCRTGEAKITLGYNLKARYVIHTVGPVYRGDGSDAAYLSACYINSLNLARLNNIRSIAFPAISTGAYGYPPQEAAGVAMRSVAGWLAENKDYEIGVTFFCFDGETRKFYEDWFAVIFG